MLHQLLVLYMGFLGMKAISGMSNSGAGDSEIRCMEKERVALLEFKDNLVDNQNFLSSWDTMKDCCQWQGIFCSNITNHVLALDLSSKSTFGFQFQLRGNISHSLLDLQEIVFLDLSSIDFRGYHIPEIFGSFVELQALSLPGTGLSGSIPHQLGNLGKLRGLDLRNNNLEGRIPHQLANLSRLEILGLANNKLEGTIPPQLGNLSNLFLLDLNLNHLTGTIPPQLASLSMLQFVDLSDNNLEGKIPPQLGNLSKNLVFLDLGRNNFLGPVPYQLGNLSGLQLLDLSYNSFLDVENLEWLSNLSSLKHLRMKYVNLQKVNGWLQIVSRLPSLSNLSLSSCQLPAVIPSSFSQVNVFTSLLFLDLSGNNLFSSSIFSWLFNVSTGLVKLDLSYNQLRGPIPDDFRDLLSLQYIDLSSNYLEGGIPRALGNLCNLRALKLSANNLAATMVDSFTNFSACILDGMEILDLDENQFSGNFPDLKRFSSLREINFAHNQLTGSLSEGVGQLSKLEVLEVSSNFLEGIVSESLLLNLPRLWILGLSSNSLVLNVSPSWVPPSQLNIILLRSCKMGPQFPQWLRSQKYFSFLDISNNGISDVIPTWFWDLSFRIKYLNLSYNQIHGNLPDQLLKFADYPLLDLSYNSFDGPLPSVPAETIHLDLSKNMFSGSISSICTIAGGFLNYLDLSFNLLSGELPDCWMNMPELLFLAMVNNNFSGKIPPSFGSLLKLHSLHLSNNSLSGELPSSMNNCVQLLLIDLGGNELSGRIPAWIGKSPSSLMVLRLRSNKFDADLPVELCNLQSIQILDISLNSISGTIPRCVDNFTAMAQKGSLAPQIGYEVNYSYPGSYSFSAYYLDSVFVAWKEREYDYWSTLGLVKVIDFSSNNFTGTIPEGITSLFGLLAVNLSRNQLGGMIPETIGQMESLESLDLSRNQLWGEIPQSISDLHFLSHLFLSYNNLSGRIPSSTQLQSLGASSFEGNPDLCGPPLTIECPGDNNGNEDDHGDNDGWFDVFWFYVGIGSGFIVGFWGVCGALMLNSSWRYAYFRFLDNVKDWLFVKLAGLQMKFRAKR